MNNRSEAITSYNSVAGTITSWFFGILFFAVGLVNMFWGNDLGFGVFIVLLSFVYFPPVTAIVKDWTGFSVPLLAKILLALFIIWASVGVGELFNKVELMMNDFK